MAVVASGIHLGERCSNVEDARAYLQVALDGVARANEFTSSVLAFAAHNSEDVCFANLSELIDSFLPLLKCAVVSDVCIAIETTPGLPTCRTKVGNFQHALLNLVINARDAQPRDGVVRITTDCVEPDFEVGKKERHRSFV